MDTPYFVYILRCADDSLYTGITTDVHRRFAEHCGKPVVAKYTSAHAPIRIEAVWQAPNRSVASKAEYRIKHLPRAKKETLIANPALLSADEDLPLQPCVLP